MRRDFLELLISPFSGAPLRCEEFNVVERAGIQDIEAGRLYTETEEYPIINGIPRILSAALLGNALKNYPDFSARYGARFSTWDQGARAGAPVTLEERTQDSFGFQWNSFSDFYLAEWEQNFQMYSGEHLNAGDFKAKRVLDAGCGFGRHLYFVARAGAQVAVGVDLSHAVDAAARNLGEFSNVLLIQADIQQLPLLPVFDVAYTIGVLQHLRCPGKAIQALVNKSRPGGKFFSWVYGPRPRSYHLVVDGLRKFTVAFSPRALYGFTFILALLSFLAFVWPRRLLEHCGCSSLGARIPFSHYARYPFRVSHADWYDRLSAPKTEYFSQDACEAMVAEAGLEAATVKSRPGGGWLLFGIRPAA